MRILPLTYCIRNKSPLAVGVLVNPDFTIQAAGFYYSADVSTEEETIRFIMLCI
ncbi:hypothetical protein ACFFIX_22835 [Metabacillus herbersteinensis]|uniref:Uncharacterized protein n=1 Tax=Metabacillus herbersteinensis TaxID=283816 RepID=A0ABV6GKH4_9BACI